MLYTLYMKSHCEAPDYEDECDARTKQEALKKFSKRLNKNASSLEVGDVWTEEDLDQYVTSEEDGVVSA